MDRICYVTTSRGVVLAELSTPQQAQLRLDSERRNRPDLKLKIVQGTKCRLILNAPTSLSIPEDSNIVVIGDKAYAYLKDHAFEVYEDVDEIGILTCPYTGTKGIVDCEWYHNWKPAI